MKFTELECVLAIGAFNREKIITDQYKEELTILINKFQTILDEVKK